MKLSHTLLLASSSQSRHMLLTQVKIPFAVIKQTADEAACDWGMTLQKVVESIALSKMEHVIMPESAEGDVRFVLTADTLSEDHAGIVSGKPIDRDHARALLKAARQGPLRTGTAFCLDRKVYRNGAWVLQERVMRFVEAYCTFNVPDEWIEYYLDNSPVLSCAGAIAIEEFGSLFVHTVQGSYTAIVGLPVCEVRQELEQLGFFE